MIFQGFQYKLYSWITLTHDDFVQLIHSDKHGESRVPMESNHISRSGVRRGGREKVSNNAKMKASEPHGARRASVRPLKRYWLLMR